MQKCKEKHRPRISELPDLFDRFGGNLTKLADHIGYKPRQVQRWIAEAKPVDRELLQEALEKARAREARAKALRPTVPAFILPAEVKHILHEYYHTPWKALAGLDKIDLDGMGYEKSVSIRKRPNPTTGQTLHEKLGWADVRELVESLSEWDDHVLRCWVGLGDSTPLKLRLEQEEAPPPPKITLDHQDTTLREVFNKLVKYL